MWSRNLPSVYVTGTFVYISSGPLLCPFLPLVFVHVILSSAVVPVNLEEVWRRVVTVEESNRK